MKARPILLLIILLALPALACNFVDQMLEPAPTIGPPPTDLGTAVPVEGTADPAMTPIGAPTGVVTATGTAPASLAELGEPPQDAAALAGWLGQAYSAQPELDALCTVLRTAAWMAPGGACAAADLDGAAPDEWLLALYREPTPDPGASGSVQGPPGDFWIVSAAGVAYQMQEQEGGDPFGGMPVLVELVDMTGDERDDAVLMFVTCGAHTCYNNYQIVSAHGGPIRSVVVIEDEALAELTAFISMPTVEEEELADATDDELPDLVIGGGLIGSAGAGIQRPYREVWAWDGANIVLADREWEDTGYRFHRLYNANDAFADEEYAAARTLYESVIVDPALQEVDYAYTVEQVRAATRQFAGFRLALLPLLQGDITEATRWRNWLQEEYPNSSFADAAGLLIETWQQNGNNLPGACSSVTSFLAAEAGPTNPLEDMGYGNPSLTAEDACPL